MSMIRPARNLKLAVPPGVGDVYWALTKLRALRERCGADKVQLYVQKTRLTRAVAWARMVPQLVTTSTERPFSPDADCLGRGYSTKLLGVHAILWPNGPLDRGEPLRNWLPELGEPDLSFEVLTEKPGRPPGAVVYVSSDGVNKAWAPNLGPEFWRAFIDHLGVAAGAPPTLIGAHWDDKFAKQVGPRAINLIGKTSLQQVAGIIRSARVLVGIISGMTILGNHFRTPTVAIRPIVPLDPRAWVAPDAPYLPVDAPTCPSPSGLAALAASIMR